MPCHATQRHAMPCHAHLPPDCCARAVFTCPALTAVTSSATQLVHYETNTLYTYTSTLVNYATASAACANTQPVPGVVMSGTLVCFSSGYSEHLAVESYFRAQNPGMTGYWIGLRQPGLGTNPYSKYNFAWEDGAPAPSLYTSGKDYEGAGYSHYGLYWYNGVQNPDGSEPNNVSCKACADVCRGALACGRRRPLHSAAAWPAAPPLQGLAGSLCKAVCQHACCLLHHASTVSGIVV